jgi:hypothetical protein
LVESSWQSSLINIKDYGELSSDSHIKSKAIFKLVPGQDFQAVQ